MKIRESGMPEMDYWESLFDVNKALDKLEIAGDINNIAEFGSGYGTFTIPASKKINGIVKALDIDSNMNLILAQRIDPLKISNVEISDRDFINKGTGLDDDSMDYVMLFNILHHDNNSIILKEATRIVRPGGKIGVLHWRSDIQTPRGPSSEIRSTPDDIKPELEKFNLKILKNIIIEPYHFGMLAQKV